MGTQTGVSTKIKKAFKFFGSWLITGASDDDSSGITSYYQAGAKFGIATLWTSLITFPVMAAIQKMSVRIGLETSDGLITTLKKDIAILLNIGKNNYGEYKNGLLSNTLSIITLVPNFRKSDGIDLNSI